MNVRRLVGVVLLMMGANACGSPPVRWTVDNDTVSVTQGQSVTITYTLERNDGYASTVLLGFQLATPGVSISMPDGASWNLSAVGTRRVVLTADSDATLVVDSPTQAEIAVGDELRLYDAGTITVVAA